MIYNINDNILYDEEEGTLAHMDNEGTKIALLKPSARLLSLFIQNNNVLLLRDKLINEVWVEHGLKASNNNLNNYISGLRKSLAQFGEEKLIITYPRQGFKFSARVIHMMNENNPQTKNQATLESSTGKEKNSVKRYIAHWPLLQKFLIFLTTGLLAISLIALYQSNKNISIRPTGSYKRCQIYSMKSEKVDVEHIRKTIQQAKLNCDSRADIYYYGIIREGSKNSTELLTFCPRETNHVCANHYIDKRSF